MTAFSQDFIDAKLAAIRATQNRAPEKPVDKAKEKQERKEQREKERASIAQSRKSKAGKPKKITTDSDDKDPAFAALKKKAFKPEAKQEKVFKTKPVDYTHKILVRVNRNTQVYVDPDNYDLEALREKYKPKPVTRAEKF